jgi:hypothetical protein
LDRHLATTDLKRLKYITKKRDLVQEQAEARKDREKRLTAERKGIKTRTYVSDATADQVAKFRQLREKGEPGFMRRAGGFVKDALMGTLDVAEKAVGVATPVLGLYTQGRLVDSKIARADARAKTEGAKAEQAGKQAEEDVRKQTIANDKSTVDKKMAESQYAWRYLYYLKDAGFLRLLKRFGLGAVGGFSMGGGPWGAAAYGVGNALFG